MAGIFIGSSTAGTGKSIFSFSLGILLQNAGYKVGYMKPIGQLHQQVEGQLMGDADALVIQELLGQQVAADVLSPFMLPKGIHELPLLATKRYTQETKEKALSKIRDAYATISQGKHITLVSGSGPFPESGRVCGADCFAIVEDLDLKVILVERFSDEFVYDAVPHLKDRLSARFLGVVLNDVPDHALRDAHEVLVPYLNTQGCEVLGVVPHEPVIAAIKVFDLAYALGGRIVAGNTKMSQMIEGFLIGSMQVDNFMTQLRQQGKGMAAIVGGDSADLQLAALHGNVPCVVLTGNRSPCEMVRTLAEKRNIPLICVKEDTYTVARSMEYILKSKKIGDLGQIRAAVSLVGDHLELAPVLNIL